MFEQMIIYSELAADASRANSNIIIPERIYVPAVRFPPEINPRDLGLIVGPYPLVVVGVRDTSLDGQSRDSIVVQPRLDGSIGAEVVFEALEATCGKSFGGGNSLRREIRERGVVRLAVVHEDVALAANAEVLVRAQCWVGHDDKRDVVLVEGRLGFAGRGLVSILFLHIL